MPANITPGTSEITDLDVLAQWPLIVADLLDIGIDVYSGILRQRSGRWLSDAIRGQLTGDRRLAAWKFAMQKKAESGEV